MREAIQVARATPAAQRAAEPQRVSSPLPAAQVQPAHQVPAQFAAAPMNRAAHGHAASHQAMAAPYRTQGQGHTAARPASMGGMMAAPIAGQPVPMAPHAAVGAPRYDSPQLPNYAWPGYAAHPNYAAVTYPQQYSPSAWPYIGPFYPYPQVPLGWRKVSLEWDDGWWFLDFTDR